MTDRVGSDVCSRIGSIYPEMWFDKLTMSGGAVRIFTLTPVSSTGQAPTLSHQGRGSEVATWFDRLTMSGCAPRNDSRPLGFRFIGIVPGSLYVTGHSELSGRWLRRMTSCRIKSKIPVKRSNGTRSSRRDPNPAMRRSMSIEEAAQWRYPRR